MDTTERNAEHASRPARRIDWSTWLLAGAPWSPWSSPSPNEGSVRAPRPGPRRWSGRCRCSCLGAVAQVHHAVAEPALVQQFELKPDPVGEELLAAAQHDGPDEQVVLVHQPGGDRMGAEGGTAHGEITLGGRLQVPDRFGVKVWFDPRPGGGGRRQRPGVHDLVGRLPDLGELPRAGRLGRGGGVGLPDLHQLVQPASVQVGADRPQQVVDEGEVLLVGCPPVELAVLVGDVAVKGRIHHIEQLGHGEPSSRVGAARPYVSSLRRGCVTARQPLLTLSEHRSCPSPDMSQIPLLNAWPGGLLCPWTRGTPWHASRPQGASVKAVQAQLGHASATVTLDRYGHLFPDELQRLADRLQEAYGDAITDPARTVPSETAPLESKEAGQGPASAGGGGETRTPVPRRRSRDSPSAAAG